MSIVPLFRAPVAPVASERVQPMVTDAEMAAAIEWCDSGWRIERRRFQISADPMHDTRSRSFKNALDVLLKLCPPPVQPTEPVASESEWQKVALELGEQLSSVGPPCYYQMVPSDWLAWAKRELIGGDAAMRP